MIYIYIFKVKTFWSQIKMEVKETNLLTIPKPSKFQSTPCLFWKWIKLTRVFESCSVCTVYGCNILDTLKLDTPKDLPKLGSCHSPTFFCVAELTPGSKSFYSYLSNESCIQSYGNYTNKVHIYKPSLVALTNKMVIIRANNLTIFKIFIWTEKCTHGIVLAWDV